MVDGVREAVVRNDVHIRHSEPQNKQDHDCIIGNLQNLHLCNPFQIRSYFLNSTIRITDNLRNPFKDFFGLLRIRYYMVSTNPDGVFCRFFIHNHPPLQGLAVIQYKLEPEVLYHDGRSRSHNVYKCYSHN